jgi:hypothetical protein
MTGGTLLEAMVHEIMGRCWRRSLDVFGGKGACGLPGSFVLDPVPTQGTQDGLEIQSFLHNVAYGRLRGWDVGVVESTDVVC